VVTGWQSKRTSGAARRGPPKTRRTLVRAIFLCLPGKPAGIQTVNMPLRASARKALGDQQCPWRNGQS
jgi:hypothetical protein